MITPAHSEPCGSDFIRANAEADAGVSHSDLVQPLTAEAAGALLPLLGADVASARVATDATLHLVIGEAAIEVRPNDNFEAWQFHGPRNLRVACARQAAITSPCSNLTRKSDVLACC